MQTSAGLISGFVKETDMGNAKENKREWKLSEVVQETGLSRKALQEYDRLGIVSPTSKTEGGYWLYDEQAVDKLRLVSTFRLVGYSRAQIKELLDSADGDNIDILSANLGKALDALRKKKEQIDKTMQLLEFEREMLGSFADRISEQVEYQRSRRIDFKRSLTENHTKALGNLMFAGTDETARNEIMRAMEPTMLLQFFGAYVDEDEDPELVRRKTEELLDAWDGYILELPGLSDEKKKEIGELEGKERLQCIRDFMFAVAEAQVPDGVENTKTVIDGNYGKGTFEKVKEIIDRYIEDVKEN